VLRRALVLFRRLRGRFGRGADDRELAEEMAWHQQRLSRDLESQGLAPDDARHAARRKFGNSTRLREEVFDMWQLGSLDQLAQDLRYGARTLRRSPGFTLVAVLILALGIGSTTAIFSAVETLLLRPLPFAEPERLMRVSLTTAARFGRPPGDDMIWSWPKARTFQSVQASYQSVGLYTDDRMTINSGEAVRENGEAVSAGYLATLGIRPALGADFPREIDAAPNPPPVALISDELWKRDYNADPGVLGKPIDVDRKIYTIIGVMPAGFRGLSGNANLWVPILNRQPWVFDSQFDHSFVMVARLKPGVTPAQATAETKVLGSRVDAAHQEADGGIASRMGATAVTLDGTRVDPRVRRSVLVLLGAVSFVLLIACANIANLFLVRARARQREIAVRLAMGAARRRVVRQLMTESGLLAILGGVAGVLLAWWGVKVLSALNPSQALGAQRLGGLGAVNLKEIGLDLPALGFAAAVTMLTGLLFGILPALKATGLSLSASLKEGSPQTGPGTARRGGAFLVVTEIALAVVLLAGAGLMIKSLANRMQVNSGVEPEQVLTLRLTLAPGQTARDSLPGFYDQLLERLAGVAGVTSVALGNCAPLAGGCNGTSLDFRDRPPGAQGTSPDVGVQWVTPAWFSTLGVPLVQGRVFSATDRMGAPKVVLVSATAARRFWPNEDAVGHLVAVGQGGFGDTATVVGVVGDVRFGTLDSLPGAEVYLPYYQSPRQSMIVYVKTSGDPTGVIGGVRAAVKDVSSGLPVYDVRTLESRVADASAQARFSAILLGLFAAMALVLASLGIYGVISFLVAQRTREIGIRVALGAVRGDVRRMIVRQGVLLALSGAAVGLVAAFFATKVLATLLYDVTPADPATYGTIVVLIVLAALLASWIPARRATRIDPMEALRSE
jgi:putative ABC transport system permease protein